MKITKKTGAAAAALFVGSLLAGPVLATGSGDRAPGTEGAVAVSQITEPVAPSLFVPVEHFRAMDSRDGDGKMVVGGEPDESVRFADLARRADDEFSTRKIPAEAVAVSFNVTVSQTEGQGFLHVGSPVEDPGEASTLNWYGDDQIVANSGVTIVGSTDADVVLFSRLTVGGEPGAAAQVIVDVTGYYIPAEAAAQL